jgi:hypothetical protein
MPYSPVIPVLVTGIHALPSRHQQHRASKANARRQTNKGRNQS